MTLKKVLLGTACLTLLPFAAAAGDLASCKGKLPQLNVIGQGMPAVTALDAHLAEQVAQRDATFDPFEGIVLVDSHPRQLAPFTREMHDWFGTPAWVRQ